jgi:lipoprotein signal peptidase
LSEWVFAASRSRQRRAVLVLFASVIVGDQLLKWWAWRHVTDTRINNAGDGLVPATMSEWLADPVPGAALDVLNALLLSLAVLALWRASRNRWVRISGTLMLAGWSSNLLDRLGLHFWTAPHSVRGAVDFMHLGRHYYNGADLIIIAATPVFAVSVLLVGIRVAITQAIRLAAAFGRPPAARALPARPRRERTMSARTRAVALSAVLGAVGVTAIGAIDSGTVTAAATLASSR